MRPPASPPPREPLDAGDVGPFVRLAKRQLRKARRALRHALPAAARAERSRAIVERLLALPEVHGAVGVALFHPMEEKGEVDLRGLHDALASRGVRLYYPTTEGDTPVLRRADDRALLVEMGSGYVEPPADAEIPDAGDVSVVVVPALAVSSTGHRLGYGAGFYDTLLPRLSPPAVTIVVAFDFELLAELPVDPWDVPCGVVVTDRREIRV